MNLAPALLGVPFGAYLAATALGILPASLVYAGVGRGLGSLLSANQELGASLLLEARVLPELDEHAASRLREMTDRYADVIARERSRADLTD